MVTAVGPAYGLVSHPENIYIVLPYIRHDFAPRKPAQGSAGIPKPPPRVGSRNFACGTPECYRLVGYTNALPLASRRSFTGHPGGSCCPNFLHLYPISLYIFSPIRARYIYLVIISGRFLKRPSLCLETPLKMFDHGRQEPEKCRCPNSGRTHFFSLRGDRSNRCPNSRSTYASVN